MKGQTVIAYRGRGLETLDLPNSDAMLLPSLSWGRHDVVFTPAYWKSQLWQSREQTGSDHYRLARTLREEVVNCLLGGHGIPAEIGIAAFTRLRDSGIMQSRITSQRSIQRVLEAPIPLGDRTVKYRFARQKSSYVLHALQFLAQEQPPEQQDRAFRDWLLQIHGIGLKTASWITRNWLGSDQVAIIDIHIYRAGLLTGFFPEPCSIANSYLALEDRFLAFAHALEVRARDLDALIWRQMRQLGPTALRTLNLKCPGAQ